MTNDDFKTILSNLAPAKELTVVRRDVKALENKMTEAIESEDYALAGKCRDDIKELRARDPASLTKELRETMWKASESDDFATAADARDKIKALKEHLPEYQLAGRWIGNVPDQGQVVVDIKYNGDQVTARQENDAKLFEADVSDSKEAKQSKSIDYNGKTYEEFFEGKGHIEGGALDGRLYMLDNGEIAFLFDAGGGGEKQLVGAGGGPGMTVNGPGELLGPGKGRGGGGFSSGGGGGDGQGGGRLLVVFAKYQ